MKIQIDSKELLKALKPLAKVADGRTLPVLDNIRFIVEEDLLYLRGSNLNVTIDKIVELQSLSLCENGEALLPAQKLVDTLGVLSGVVTIEADAEKATIKAGSGKYKMATQEVSAFPSMVSAPDVPDICFGESDDVLLKDNFLRRAIEACRAFVSNDDLRPATQGVNVSFESGAVEIAATDAHKLLVIRLPIHFGAEKSFIVSGSVLPSVSDIYLIGLSIGEKTCYFHTTGGGSVAFQAIDARYPNYRAVIPEGNDKVWNVQKSELIAALNRIGVYSDNTTRKVVITVDDQACEIQASDYDNGYEATETLERTRYGYEGAPIRIAFNAKYLVTCLQAIPGESVNISMSTPNRAALLGAPGDESIMALCMPVMLSE